MLGDSRLRPVLGFHPSAASMEESYALRESGRQILKGLIEARAARSQLHPDHARDPLLAMMHGLKALHMADEPHLAPGTGQFGALIEGAVELFRTSREPRGKQGRL